MIGIRARHLALVAFIFSACAGEGDPSSNSSAGNDSFGSAQSALDPITVDACGDQDDLSYGTCVLENPPTTGNPPPDLRVWPSLFQIIGLNPDEGAGIQQVNEAAFTFKSIRYGRPGSVTVYMRRILAMSDPVYHDIVFDLVGLNADGTVPIPRAKPPPTCGYGILDNQLGRARYDASKIPYSLTNPVDQKIHVNFTSSSATFLEPTVRVAVYVHLESPAKDRLGLAGTEADVYAEGQPYTRQARVVGAACLTNPSWSGVGGRDVYFKITVNDGCTAGASAPSCGKGICFRDNVPQCDSYGNFQPCFASYCDFDNDIRCVPEDPDDAGPVTIDPNDYGCNVEKLTCFKRTAVAKSCTTNAQCKPQIPNGTVVLDSDYTCNQTTNTCNPPLNGLECFVANDPICVPAGGVASNFGCDLMTNRCYTLYGAINESCNGLDDDCDNTVDNNLPSVSCGVGKCQRMEYTCNANGTPFTCPNPDPRINAVAESCNSIDDNCDGLTDNGIPDMQCGVGQCFVSGVNACPAVGVPSVCTPKPAGSETCDGRDEDCDGFMDNAMTGVDGFMTQPYYANQDTSTVGKGTCRMGEQECSGPSGAGGGWVTTLEPVTPVPDTTCDGLDTNCDGFVDNAIPGLASPQLTQPLYTVAENKRNVGRCRDGQQTCGGPGHTAGVWWDSTPEITPLSESCNNVDDDCNGAVDDGLGTRVCGQGVCQVTVGNCVAGAPPAECGVPDQDPQSLGDQSKRVMGGENTSLCDGLDNDCDGKTDNLPDDDDPLWRECFTGPGIACTVVNGHYTCNGICRAGKETCGSGYWPTVGKPAAGIPGSAAACSDQILPGTEACDNLDNDCDSAVDENPDSLCPTTTQNATAMTCGTFGTKMCVVKTCLPYFYDMNRDPADGCEVRDDDKALGSPSNTSSTQCLAGYDLGTLPVASGTAVTISQLGLIPDKALYDYFKLTIAPQTTTDTGAQTIRIALTDTNGNVVPQFKFDIYSSSCGTSGGTNLASAYSCSNTTLNVWEFTDNCATGNGSGVCNTRNYGFPSSVQIRVKRDEAAQFSATQYKLTITRTPITLTTCPAGYTIPGSPLPVGTTSLQDQMGAISGLNNFYHYYNFTIASPGSGNVAAVAQTVRVTVRDNLGSEASPNWSGKTKYKFDIFSAACSTNFASNYYCNVGSSLDEWSYVDNCYDTTQFSTHCKTRQHPTFGNKPFPTTVQVRVKRVAGAAADRYRLQVTRNQ